MAGQDEGQERTEQPTPRRLERAREEGQVPRSRELATMGVLLVGGAATAFLGPSLVTGLMEVLREGLVRAGHPGSDSAALLGALAGMTAQVLLLLAPLFVILVAVALLAPLALGGWTFAGSALGFKWERLDPVKGLKRVVGLQGLMELTKALAKFLVIAGASVALLWFRLEDLLALGEQPLPRALADAGGLLMGSFLLLCAGLVLIAGVDVPFQLWHHNKQLRMSRQDVKEEFKETEGHPEVKSRIRALQREVAQRRMMEEVPKADVVVTNPTHYAVALRYDPDRMAAPRVVAKGRELVAAAIRDLAQGHAVPVVSAPPLARALFHGTELNQEIPAGLYRAVAQVLAYVYQLAEWRRRGGHRPTLDSDLPIPDHLRRDA